MYSLVMIPTAPLLGRIQVNGPRWANNQGDHMLTRDHYYAILKLVHYRLPYADGDEFNILSDLRVFAQGEIRKLDQADREKKPQE